MKSPIITRVGKYSMDKLPFSIWSVRKKSGMFKEQVSLLEVFLALFSRRILDVFSWYSIFLSISYPLYFRNNSVESIIVDALAEPTS